MISIGLVGAGDAAGYYLSRDKGCDHDREREQERDRDHGRGHQLELGPERAEKGHGPEPTSGVTVDYYTGEHTGEHRADDESGTVDSVLPAGTSARVTVGRWLGGGAAALGLAGDIDTASGQVLRDLLAGRGVAGQRLVAPVLRADPRGRLAGEPLIRALERVLPRAAWSDLGDARQVRQLHGLAARVDAGRPATLAVEELARIAGRAGLDPVALYRDSDGTDRFTAASRHADKRVDVRRAGLDVTVSAPKSVSVLLALGTPEVERAVRAAHASAVGEVVTYLQRHAARAARGHQGDGQRAHRIASDGLIVAAFDHLSSRAGDPQLHTHLVIPNLIHAIDGRWSALDSRALFRHARTATSLYQAVLRGELSRTLGVGWSPVGAGIAEVAGIPAAVRAVFSKRRAQITRALASKGVTGAKAAQAACLATRPSKKHEPTGTSRTRWAEEARAAGFSTDALARLLHGLDPDRAPAGFDPNVADLSALADQLFGPTGVTAAQTTFTRQDLARELCDRLPAGTPLTLATLDRLVERLIAHPDVIPILATAPDIEAVTSTATPCVSGGVGERRYTTAELLAVEQHALALATQPATHPVPAAGVPQASDPSWAALALEQQRMVARLLAGTRAVDVVAGPPGCGKSAALAVAHAQWQQAGITVWGASMSRLAANNLHTASGIPTTSVTAMLRHADRQRLPAGLVLVIDEASLVDTRTLARLLDAVHTARGKLVLVGDPQQLPEIGAGGLYTHLAAGPDTIALTGNQRQTQLWERQALARYRTGDLPGALDLYAAHDCVHTADTVDELLDSIAGDYLAAIDRGDDVLVLAPRRADVDALNSTIRARLLEEGHLGRDELTISGPDTGDTADRAYRVGDRVMVTANDPTLGLVNGARGTVTTVNRRKQQISVHVDGRHVTLGGDWLATGNLAHGYALTVHKAQGLTVDTTLTYASTGLTREHAYVALSRGRAANHLYLAPTQRDRPDCAPSTRGEPATLRTLLDNLLEQIHDRTTQQLASVRIASADPRIARRRAPTGFGAIASPGVVLDPNVRGLSR